MHVVQYYMIFIIIQCLLSDFADVFVTDYLNELIEESKNKAPPARSPDVAELNRALFTIGLISKHFDFADIIDDTTHVCYFAWSWCYSLIVTSVLFVLLS